MNRYPVLNGISWALLIAAVVYYYMATRDVPRQEPVRLAPSNVQEMDSRSLQPSRDEPAISAPTAVIVSVTAPEPTPIPALAPVEFATSCTVRITLENGMKGEGDHSPDQVTLQSEDAARSYTGVREATSPVYVFSSIPQGRYQLQPREDGLYLHGQSQPEDIGLNPVITVVDQEQEEHLIWIALTPVRVRNTEQIPNTVIECNWGGVNDLVDRRLRTRIPSEFKYMMLPLPEWTDPQKVFYVIPGNRRFLPRIKKGETYELLGRQEVFVTVPAQKEIYEIDLNLQMGGSVRGIIDNPLYDDAPAKRFFLI